MSGRPLTRHVRRAAITGVVGLSAHRKQSSRKPWILTIAFALLAGMFVIPASANAAAGGGWACNGVVARSGTGHYGEVNEQVFPCDDDVVGFAALDLGLAQVTNVQAYTSWYHNSAYASADTLALRVGDLRVSIGAITASAKGSCSFGHPHIALSSKVAGLRINGGLARVITGYVKINLANGIVLELNKTTTYDLDGALLKTRQALVISFGFSPGQIVVGEASAGYYGNPCRGGD